MYSIEARASLLLRMQSSCNYICTYTITDDVLYCYIENRANGTPIMFFYNSGERIREFNCCCCTLVRRLVIDIIVLLRTLS